MRRALSTLQWLTLICSFVLVYSAVQALGAGPFGGLEGDPPNWVDGLLYWIVLANGTVAISVGWRGVTASVAAVLTFVGLTTLMAGGILKTFQGGLLYTPTLLAVSYLGGCFLASIGIWRFDPHGLRAGLSSRSGRVIGLGIGMGMLVGEAMFGAVSTVVRLLPLLWANEVGTMLVPVAVIAGLRWLATDGIRRDDIQSVRVGCVVVATIGALVVLLTPTVDHVADTSISRVHTAEACTYAWADEFEYAVDWSAIHFRWSDGCAGTSTFVNPGYSIVGGLFVLAGVVGERVATIRER